MNALDSAIYDAMAANVALTAMVPAARFYIGQAPQGAVAPYVIFMQHAGGDVNDTPVDSLNLVYQVRAVSDKSAAEAGQIDDLLRAALHKATLAVSGWNNCWTAREGEFRNPETDDGKSNSGVTRWHAGALYRILLDK